MAPDSGVPGAVPAVPAIVGTASVPPIWRNQSFQESLGGNSDRQLDRFGLNIGEKGRTFYGLYLYGFYISQVAMGF
jgi:hypothetical protein